MTVDLFSFFLGGFAMIGVQVAGVGAAIWRAFPRRRD